MCVCFLFFFYFLFFFIWFHLTDLVLVAESSLPEATLRNSKFWCISNLQNFLNICEKMAEIACLIIEG